MEIQILMHQFLEAGEWGLLREINKSITKPLALWTPLSACDPHSPIVRKVEPISLAYKRQKTHIFKLTYGNNKLTFYISAVKILDIILLITVLILLCFFFYSWWNLLRFQRLSLSDEGNFKIMSNFDEAIVTKRTKFIIIGFFK